jgi:hypothetical protein
MVARTPGIFAGRTDISPCQIIEGVAYARCEASLAAHAETKISRIGRQFGLEEAELKSLSHRSRAADECRVRPRPASWLSMDILTRSFGELVRIALRLASATQSAVASERTVGTQQRIIAPRRTRPDFLFASTELQGRKPPQ